MVVHVAGGGELARATAVGDFVEDAGSDEVKEFDPPAPGDSDDVDERSEQRSAL